MYKYILAVYLVVLSIHLRAQVATTSFSESAQLEAQPYWNDPANGPKIDLQLPKDFQGRTKAAQAGSAEEIAYRVFRTIDYSDGLETVANGLVTWQLTVSAKQAMTLSFRFSEISLPERGELYLYSPESFMSVGPITRSNVVDETLNTDYINGSTVTLVARWPEVEKAPTLVIDSYMLGVRALAARSDAAFGSSLSCNINASCPSPSPIPDLDLQIESVCKILIGSGACTGALINNACNDYTPYVLTAEHCFLSTAELTNAIFRFNYESAVCVDSDGDSQGVEPDISRWVSYSGGTEISSWDRFTGSDFTLLELRQQLREPFAFSGWDRRNLQPANSTFIHHPRGDVKKVTFESDQTTPDGNFFDFVLTPGTGGDRGSLEGASSGAPHYNPQGRIVGWISSGWPHSVPCDATSSVNSNGRLFSSWLGGGTAATRLRDALGAGRDPNFMTALESANMNGIKNVCNSTQRFTLVNRPPNSLITWTVSPRNLATITENTANFVDLSPVPGRGGKLP
ncbi:trypsin-like serine peptidase [Neolewinella antarctica]|uniref:Trypsin-like serine protease n=1 Tax=Neolewinella antarctica TaxID=442734 RepID=A0ABX0X8R0_9BACT|nr:hypothetical protein [Neolewinella antarctica]NJC25643.1 hypothetical protein [Neolewinella antarctica]